MTYKEKAEGADYSDSGDGGVDGSLIRERVVGVEGVSGGVSVEIVEDVLCAFMGGGNLEEERRPSGDA